MKPNAILRQRQEEELEVIKAIYIQEVQDLQINKDHIKVSLLLGPLRGSSGVGQSQPNHTSVVLWLTIHANYPNIVPKISLESAKGLSTQEVSELKQGLESLAESNIGEEMILNLAQFTQDFLYEHQKRPTGSFYDEMLMRNQLQEEKTKKKEKEFQEQEVLGIRYEIERKKELLKEEARSRKEELKMYSDLKPELETETRLGTSASKEFPKTSMEQMGGSRISRRSSSLRRSGSGGDESIPDNPIDLITLEFTIGKCTQAFQRGEVLGGHAYGYKVYAAMETQTGNLVVISEWALQFSSGKTKNLSISESQAHDDVSRQLNSMESEVKVLQKLEHPNVITHIGATISRTGSKIIVYTVQDFIRGMTLQSYLEGTFAMDIPLVRHCTLGIANALAFLHSNNIVHRFLRDTSVFINSQGEVKVGDYGLERKLTELLRSVNGSDIVSDTFAPSIGRGAKKGDIYRLGIIMLSLLKGQRVTQNPPEFPRSLSSEIKDFLNRCLDTNENARWSANRLLDHAFLKHPLDKGKDLMCFKDSHAQDYNQEENDHQNEEIQNFLSQAVKGHSRLREEFEIEVWLGKGGFGDVLKVRNKLDGGVYALKRIRLNPKNKQLNKKITREVKLLSRLNHENVVRYYNSWIETVFESAEDTDTNTSPSKATTTFSKVKFEDGVKVMQNSLGILDNVEDLAPQVISKSSDWSSAGLDEILPYDSEGEESSDEEDLFGTSFLCLNDVSEDVIFGDASASIHSLSESNKSSLEVSSLDRGGGDNQQNFDADYQRESQFMYIQMEFCEKSTLRTAIDGNLYKDEERAWRLFREIVEGLAHIHQQGMIHRDLKPVNIFLDSNDSVKIGDFGLATTNIMVRNPGDVVLLANTPNPHAKLDSIPVDLGVEDSLTSDVGTALYVAPELVSKSFQASKVMYSQKVDIYSLGIVFFEMIYHPVDTGMERVRVISGLRQREIQFPSDFDTLMMPRQTILLKWLLNQDPRLRPTSQELLQSEYLPPPQMEEAELHEMFRHTLSNSQSKVYKYLISSCFQQNVSAAEELTYDMDILRSQMDPHSHANTLPLIQYVKRNIKRKCMQHGAVEVNTPKLLPKLPMYENIPSQVKLMTHSGNIVSLHHDLRVPFARYVVSNGLANIKRYAIEKVFRERKVYGFHPREFYECAFDIISSAQGSLLAEAETLSVAFEIFQELPWMREKNFTVRLGHTYLLDAVLIHFSIDDAIHAKIKAILTDIKDEKQAKSQVQTRLVSLCLPDQFISLLFTLMDIQGPLPKVSNILKSIVKRNGLAASKIKEGLHELQVLSELIEAFGIQCSVVVSPTMIFGSNIYSGLIYQITCQMKKKRNRVTMDVVAVGGKYDELLKTLRSNREIAFGVTTAREIEQCGAGISISLDLLISGSQGDDRRDEWKFGLVDVIVCSLGHHLLTKEKIAMLKKFWSHGISCTALEGSQSLETAEEQCIELGASFIVLLKEDSFNSTIRLRYLEKQRFFEKKLATAEVIDFIQSRLNCISAPLLKTELSRTIIPSSESNTQIHQGQNSIVPGINVSFVITETKDKPANWKRRQESMMIGHISEALRKLSKHQVVEILGVEVNSEAVKILSSDLDISDKDQYNKSVSEVLERHPRQKKTLKAICDEIYELIFVKNSEIIVIYSLIESFYKTLV